MTSPENSSSDTKDQTVTPTVNAIIQRDARNLLTIFLGVLAALSVLYTMFFAASILIPITLAVMISLILQPAVKALVSLRLPAPLAAGLVVLSVITLIVSGIYTLSGPASDWIDRAPVVFKDIETKIKPFRKPIKQIQDAQASIEKLTDMEEGEITETVVKKTESSSISLSETLLASSTVLINSLFVLILVYLLLSSDGNYLRKLVTILPRFQDKRRAVETTKAIQDCIAHYLSTITLINAGVGVFTALLMWYLDMPNPVLWGLMAAVMNYVPYLGPAITALTILLVGFITFDQLSQIVLPAASFVVLTTLEGQVVTPVFAGQKLELSPVAIFIFLAFMGWIWGVVGMLIAIPLLASIKIICAEIMPLQPLAIMMGRD